MSLVANEIEFFGESFRRSDDGASDFAMMEYAAAVENVAEDDLAALAAAMRLLREAIHPDDWQRFQASGRKNRADAKDLLPIIVQAFYTVAEHPTGRPSDSSDGPVGIEPSSTGSSSSPVIARLEAQGRPDLALVVVKAQEHSQVA